MADLFGFDRESAEKIARVVRDNLAGAGGEKSHRRADVSGPGNHVALAFITETGGNTHKFKFAAGQFIEEVGFNLIEEQALPDEYFAHDICAKQIEPNDLVWIVDHNNQWFIIDRCTAQGGSGHPDYGGCCGSCGGGSVTLCSECTTGNAHDKYAFDIPDFEGQFVDDPG